MVENKKRLPQYYQGWADFQRAEQRNGKWHQVANPYGNGDSLISKEWQAGFDAAYAENMKGMA